MTSTVALAAHGSDAEHDDGAPVTPAPCTPVTPGRGTLRPVGLDDVVIEAGFWRTRQDLVHDHVIPHALRWMDRLGWTGNLAAAGRGERYEHRGAQFCDSDVYKLTEAMFWDERRSGTEAVPGAIERLRGLIAGAIEPDGYLNTKYGRAWQEPRYADLEWGHELYCAGHLIQAGVAAWRCANDTEMLNLARRVADHVCVMFAPGAREQICGHPEIEVALVELSRATGERRYLDQAATFIERRGHRTLVPNEYGSAYWQDDVPVRETDALHGHAVRALYLAAAAVDVAVERGDDAFLGILATQWDNTVARRTYLTGGMGSHHMDEAFGEDYVLPADRSYCETCAGVGAIMFSWRLLLATGEAKYADLIERVLYNIVATCPGEDGESFFYANTHHQRTPAGPSGPETEVCVRGGSARRQPWYEISCCPTNVARTIAALGSYAVTADDRGVQIHQYVAGRFRLDQVGGAGVELRCSTDYPHSSRIEFEIVASAEQPWELALRIPAWANGATVRVGDEPARPAPAGAYARITRTFAPADRVVLDIPVDARVTYPDPRVDAVRGCVAVERGPVVLCLESIDLPDHVNVDQFAVDVTAPPRTRDRGAEVAGVLRDFPQPSWPLGPPVPPGPHEQPARVELIPYHSWANRGPSTMRVWLPTR